MRTLEDRPQEQSPRRPTHYRCRLVNEAQATHSYEEGLPMECTAYSPQRPITIWN